ncbi:uncharacterized protein LOC103717519 [Phoenix dactylifera]|uniref:Uncharacterized protein LOC103717519 n=1 Tax=Phoenix dactylifera TaxID=42345 RepID=A0A8B7CQG5_PHODC|nr:uncharacterized protein LOC103717519 [Phoenix dactylifera]
MEGGMGNSSSEDETPVSIRNPNLRLEKGSKKKKKEKKRTEEEEEDMGWEGRAWESEWPKRSRGGGGVMLEGYVEAADGAEQGSDGGDGVVGRTKSLTDEDLEELKGCLDLGFGFSYEEIPELCNTLPALELCYSMSQRFLDEQQQQTRSPEAARDAATAEPCASAASPVPVANWKISSPGDHPEEVKARLKYWAQAVACTVRLCN